MKFLPLFYYPTQIVWVDDDKLFLKAAQQLFSEDFSIIPFHDAQVCLSKLENYQSKFTPSTFLRSCTDNENYNTSGHCPIDFDLSALHLLSTNTNKNEEISVLIADYRIPKINGLEICKILKNHTMKKILLTGKADDMVTIDAFNSSVINKFIRKDHSALTFEIQTSIKSLSEEYFCDRTYSLLNYLEIENPLPQSDPVFINFFKKYCDNNQIHEYYLIDKQGSLKMINENGKQYYFAVHTDQSLQNFIDLHDDDVSAECFLDKIKRREKIPFFGMGRESWEFEPYAWENYFYNTELLEGNKRYYWQLISID